MQKKVDVVIIGAGASGLMCAAQAGKRGRKVLVLDHGPKPGRKILISGGGRCNFTNLQVSADHFISSNAHFCKSAVSRYSPLDFLEQVDRYNISWEERDHGQLFCTDSASQILDMLLTECRKAKVGISLNMTVIKIERVSLNEASKDPLKGSSVQFRIYTKSGEIETHSLVIATGGVSIPGVGATPFGYKVAEQFDIPVTPIRPGLVPFTLQPNDKKILQSLSGISVDAKVSLSSVGFNEKLLFTHRGISGPVILQISSYWQSGQSIIIDLLPYDDLRNILKKTQAKRPKQHLKSVLYKFLPKRLVDIRIQWECQQGRGQQSKQGLQGELQKCTVKRPIASFSHEQLDRMASFFHEWQLKPGGTEGNRTAEVTVGGVDCHHISSKTLEAKNTSGLYFIGEVLDVTGRLGGYNLQWAWSSGYCAGLVV